MNNDLYDKLKSGLFVIAGPCVMESEEHVMFMASELKKITDELGITFIFKSSFDKANRTSINSYRGLGIDKGIEVLKRVKDEFQVPVLTDVHEVSQVEKLKDVVDIMQIPAFLCRQTELLLAVANSGVIVNVKKGQFLSPYEVENIEVKVQSTGNLKTILTERGSSFGYNNLVVDMRSLEIMKRYKSLKVFDATHSVQEPGGSGSKSGGKREFVYPLARAAVAIGVDGLFFEVHDNPEEALSDGPNMLFLKDFKEVLSNLMKIDKVVKEELKV